MVNDRAKRCSKCTISKRIEEFSPQPRAKDGLEYWCKGCINANSKVVRSKRREAQLAKAKSWRDSNKEKSYASSKEWKVKSNYYARIEVKLRNNIRSRVRRGLHNKYITDIATETLIGCNIEQLKAHFELLFTEGMNWNNYGRGEGKWSIDHKRPCASFDLTIEAEQKACSSYTNLQPLWCVDNSIKGARIQTL